MTERETMEYFDHLASGWDDMCRHDPQKIDAILTLAEIAPGQRVGDIACGTGVLFPSLLARGVSALVGIDLSPRMIERAGQKCADPRVSLHAASLFSVSIENLDRCIVYSAYPHFPDRRALARKLWAMLAPGGRFTVAHSESRGTINGRHSGSARPVSLPLLPAAAEAEHFAGLFCIDVMVDTPYLYVLSGTRLETEE